LAGFTLIELSIVLVIIGLIVGGILVGQDLITAARIRAQIAQIDKYNSAVNTFRVKYNAPPGDMIPSTASTLGFFTRTGGSGDGDGDGYIGGIPQGGGPTTGYMDLGGEDILFWTDLSAAGLIEGGFNDSSDSLITATTDTQYAAEMPRAKIGNGNYVFVSGTYQDANSNFAKGNGFQIINIAFIGPPVSVGVVMLNPGLTALESFNIDQKIDDGLPLSGQVIAMLPDNHSGIAVGAEIRTGVGSLCVLLGPPVTYNIGTKGVSTVAKCSLRFGAT